MNSVLNEPKQPDPFPVLRPVVRALLRWTVYLVGTVAVLAVILGFSMTAFGAGTGRGFDLLWFMPEAAGISVAAIVGGDVVSALFRIVGRLIGRGERSRSAVSADSFSDAEPEVVYRDQSDGSARRSWKLAFFRRRWRLILVLTMILPVTAFGIGVFAGRALDDELAQAVADADRDDPFWRLDDLMEHREAVPDEENSALVVSEALSLLPGLPWPPARVPAGTPSEAEDNATLEIFEQIIATPANARLDSDVADAMRGELEEYRETVEMLRTVANFARGRHELQIGPRILDTLLEETQDSRSAGRLLAADAAIRAHDGDFDGAIDSCRAGIGVARSIGDEPFCISQIVRFATGLQAVRMARRVIGQGEASDAALAKLQELILDELSQPLMLYAVRGERATHVELFRQVATGELDAAASAGDNAFAKSYLAGEEHPAWTQCYLELQLAIVLRWMNGHVAIEQRHPAAERPALWKASEANLYAINQSRFGRHYARLALRMYPALRYCATAFEKYQSELGATAILLAAERHRRVRGAWPTSIESIEPGFLLSVPLDPFSGQSFRMERRDGQVFVYSVGLNGIDQYGAYDEKARTDGDDDDAGGSLWDVKMRGKPATDAMQKAR